MGFKVLLKKLVNKNLTVNSYSILILYLLSLLYYIYINNYKLCIIFIQISP